MTTLYADLHSHTTFSDGVLSTEALVAKAHAIGFEALAITDHDTMAAHRYLHTLGVTQPISIIPGIEVSCTENGRDVHVLGYYLDAENPAILEFEHRSRVDRERRGIEMVSKLRKAGVNVTVEELKTIAGDAPIGRPHLAQLMVNKGAVANMQEAFKHWLDVGKVGYASRERFSVRDAVRLVQAAGGVTVVAHPGRTYQDPRLFLALLSLGIDGIEVHHPSHWHVTREYYRMLALQHHLLISGGSDYHGSRSYDETNFGVFGASKEMVDAIHTKAIQRRLHGTNE